MIYPIHVNDHQGFRNILSNRSPTLTSKASDEMQPWVNQLVEFLQSFSSFGGFSILPFIGHGQQNPLVFSFRIRTTQPLPFPSARNPCVHLIRPNVQHFDPLHPWGLSWIRWRNWWMLFSCFRLRTARFSNQSMLIFPMVWGVLWVKIS